MAERNAMQNAARQEGKLDTARERRQKEEEDSKRRSEASAKERENRD
jgi:hypothetical protein